ncbi:hypothetical protein RR48_00842 [Papilio machaon]|uniref:Uncharacterized protein n=1 Tax=Papilio machaon TaxID=76193 RepID=A0A0N1PIC3_PAPMA|nr:hypothetical protein RR48_00842 [Papilio machaon]
MTPTKSGTPANDVVEKSISPTSEVGSVPAQNEDLRTPADDGWRTLAPSTLLKFGVVLLEAWWPLKVKPVKGEVAIKLTVKGEVAIKSQTS